MNILACPAATMDHAVFRRVVEGGLAKIREAGALLVGGHSVEDEELKYGLSVTGVVHPEQVLLNSGARPGDVLVLTKPLGTGILSTALKSGLAGPGQERELVELMATLNRRPMEIATGDEELRAGVHGCTDITGFGLVGHLREMAAASRVSIRIEAGALPLAEGVREYADMGLIPAGAYRNRDFYGQWLRSSLDEMDPLSMIVHDPQTSGGLLLAMTPVIAEHLLKALAASGDQPPCRIIGEVLPADPGIIHLV